MAYVYRKKIGNKEYYYLRASIRKDNKQVVKDIAYLGSDIDKIKEKLKNIPSKYSEEIRKTYKTIHRFVEVNRYLEKVKSMKLKKDSYLDKNNLEKVEACKLHWEKEFRKLDENTKEEILKQFVVEFAFNTASIEGNTITLKQAQNLLIENKTPKNKDLREIYDLQNTEKVFFEIMNKKKIEINHNFICDIHDKLLENIDNRKGYRTEDVRIFKMHFKSSPAIYVKADMALLLKWYKENKDKLHPLVLGTIFHHKFEKIHPFMDGNGRTGRILLNVILLNKGYPPIIIRKKRRTNYLQNLNNADKCELTKTDLSCYKELIKFTSEEMNENYWNIFL